MKAMKKLLVLKIVLAVSALPLTLPGCTQREDRHQTILDWLRMNVSRFENRVEAQKRVQEAISQWQNGVLDTRPVLMDATLTTSGPRDGEQIPLLVLTALDEDADLAGFVVDEEHVDSNGVKTALSEDYPIFAHLSDQVAAECWAVYPLLRRGQERKSEDKWQEYLSPPRQKLEDEYLEEVKRDVRTHRGGFWRDTLPPIWISVPEPKKVSVQLYLYDRAGHLSSRVSLMQVPRDLSGRKSQVEKQ